MKCICWLEQMQVWKKYHISRDSGLFYLSFIICFQDAKVMSWWDYGYQITAMANRTILVDNNTWNNTHISRVGQVSRQPLGYLYEVLC